MQILDLVIKVTVVLEVQMEENHIPPLTSGGVTFYATQSGLSASHALPVH